MSTNRNVVLAAACALALGSSAVSAQQASTGSGSAELEEIIVYGSQITLPPSYAGGQVARVVAPAFSATWTRSTPRSRAPTTRPS